MRDRGRVASTAPGGRTRIRPTVFGVALGVLVAVAFALRPPTADPSVTGLVGAALLGAFVVGLVWPVVLVRRVGLQVRLAPGDLVVGQLGSIEVELVGRASGLSLSCTGSGVTVLDVVSPGVIRLPLTVSARGAYRQLRIDVGTDAPFGVVRATRTRTVTLPEQLLVGPSPVPHALVPGDLGGDELVDAAAGASLRGDSVRSVRPYVSGDPSHLVHWPSTARSGQLVVRELDPPAAAALALVVDLSDPRGDGAAEVVASQVAGGAEALLGAGARVVLCTLEATGPVVAEVGTAAQIRHRLALAVAGPPPPPPANWPWHRMGVTP